MKPQPLGRWRPPPGSIWAQPVTWVLVAVSLALVASLGIRAVRGSGRARAPQVQVLNGSGVPELAQRAASALRQHGLDVVAIGNADSQEYHATLVLLRRGNIAVAAQVAAGLGRGQVMEQRDPTLLVDVTVVLGSDYAGGPQRP